MGSVTAWPTHGYCVLQQIPNIENAVHSLPIDNQGMGDRVAQPYDRRCTYIDYSGGLTQIVGMMAIVRNSPCTQTTSTWRVERAGLADGGIYECSYPQE